MKAAVVLFASAAFALDISEVRPIFDQWAQDHARSYASASEREFRLNNFHANLKEIDHLNRIHGEPGMARFRANKYADLSKAELKNRLGFRAPKHDLLQSMGPRLHPARDVKVAESRDWRANDLSVLAPIQDQGMCGSCWAFSSVTNVESTIALATNKSFVKLSEQQLVDCDQVCGTYREQDGCDAGCNGGLMPNAFTYYRDNEAKLESEYPYTGRDGRCQANGRSNGFITGFDLVSQNEDDIKTWVDTKGPVSVAVDATQWQFYFGGIMTYLCWGTTTMESLNHAVNIVGYGTEGGQDYWLIRNSWGTMWGESGYARIRRGTGFCGVNLFVCNVAVQH